MPLRSKEPPERPPAPTDLSHRSLICICHRPLIGHPSFPMSPLFPHFVLSSLSFALSLPRYPSLTLKNGCALRSPKTRLAACRPNVKLSRRPNLLCPHSTDRYHVGTLPPALD